MLVGAGETINGERRSALARDDRLKPLTAVAIGTRPADIVVTGNKDWRDGVLYWTAATADGKQFKCQAKGDDTRAVCSSG
jgi:hypothetical protein